VGYFLYNIFLTLAFVVSVPFLPLILLLGPRYREGLSQRLGLYPESWMATMKGARPVWIHAASIGEARAATVLIRAMKKRHPKQRIILSTFTATGNRIARALESADAVFFVPLDFWWIARRVVKKFDPLMLIIIETELWPNLLKESFKKGIPVVLLSGRISAASFERYRLFRGFFRHVLECFCAVGMQTAEDRQRIMELGACADKVSIVGNLKQGIAGGSVAKTGLGWPKYARNQPLLVVGSSHRGEEELLLDVFRLLKRRFADLQMVLAPRHPQRFAEIEALLRQSGLSFDKKSAANGDLKFGKEVLLLDTLGELEAFYAVGDVVFVGGSLVKAGGHNLLEPARFCKPVLFGPHVENFAPIAQELKQAGGGIEVRDKDDLINVISELLNDPLKRKRMGENAYLIAADDHGAVENNLELASRYL